MKYFIAITLIATVASAAFTKPTISGSNMDEIQQIIAAINSPSTNPATAAALQDMLLDVLGVNPEPVAVGPALVEAEYEPISVGPALIDFPLPEVEVAPTPVVVAPGPVADVSASSAPLVQIIVNIANQAAAQPSPVAPVAPIIVPEADKPEPIQVVESAPEPVQVVEVAPEPVQVIEAAPVPAEPVIVGTPIIPVPVVVLPETLN